MEPLVYSDLYFYVTQKSHHLHNAVHHLHSALLCAIQREASKDIKFPITCQFLKIQQLLSVGHQRRVILWLLGSPYLRHLPLLTAFCLAFVSKDEHIHFDTCKRGFFYFVSPSSLSITLIWKVVVHLINHPPMCRQSLHCCRGRFGSSRISWC